MMLRFIVVATASVLLLAGANVRADDLTGEKKFICSVTSAVICWDDGTCDTGTPVELNLPQFIELDLNEKRLSTTKASGLNRSTPIASIQRDGDTIILQGFENGRAFSYVIDEKTGESSATITAIGRNVSAFGACTPAAASR